MENRFALKDFFLFVFLTALIIVIMLAMKQNDRQLLVLQQIKDQGDDQMHELTALHRDVKNLLNTGIAQAGNLNQGPATQNSTPAAFAGIVAATTMPDYAQGDWLIDSGPNSDKITPLVSGDIFAAVVQGNVLDSLLTRDEVTLDWQPLLASGWHVEDNTPAYFKYVEAAKARGQTDEQIAKDPNLPNAAKVTFQIRHNITFSDGEPLTAQDVVWTFNWIMNEKVDAPRERSALQKVKSVTANGDYEVVWTLNEPYFDLLGLTGGMSIMPKHFYEKYSVDDFNKSTGLLMGSGAYRMENPTNWTPGQPIVLVRNDRYWGVAPAINRIVYKIIDNDIARMATFINGDMDVFGEIQAAVQPEQYISLQKDKEVLARTQHFAYDTAIGGYRYIAWNEQRGGKPTYFADKRVRQAMTMMTDRQRICQEVMLGFATPATGPFSPLGKQYNKDVKPWPFDVERAKGLLKEAGFSDNGHGSLLGPDGKPFEFKLTYPSGAANYDKIALFLKDTYAKAGITLTPDPLDWSVFSEHLKNRDFEAISLGWSAGIEDDIYQMFDSSQMAGAGDNFMSYKNPELDKLIEKARSTLDEGARLAMWKQCHTILHEDQPYTFMFTRKTLEFVDARFKNVRLIPLGLNSSQEWYVSRGTRKWEK